MPEKWHPANHRIMGKGKKYWFHELSSVEQETMVDQIAQIMIDCAEMNDGEGDTVEFQKRIREYWEQSIVIPDEMYLDLNMYGERWDDYFEVDKAGLIEDLISLTETEEEDYTSENTSGFYPAGYRD